jgi:nicotinic acid mononucleotide adenylyltransferase
VFGTDSIAEIPNWRGGEYLSNQLSVIAVERAGTGPVCNPLTRICAYIHEDVAGLSSTHVRKQLSIGADITNEVPLAVAGYIFEHRLYQNA